ncbi:hypothetical protein AB6A40_004096 [Gnathostoma spinigerum]|uniref:NADH dehydrogenase [ubiquinone] 1 alpha subcomplex assembly factor 3 n=1 Tax=Gnathostoma spinigerum TaxID=75299 RepID=A0ABD6EL10_9BILA
MRFFFKLPLRFISRRQLASTVGGDSILLDGWHVTPMGESDVGTRTRLSLLSKEMLESKQIGIRGLSRMGFRMIDGSFLYGPIAVFPKAVLSWRVLTPSDITSESVEFFTMLEPKLDILVVGVGDRKHVDSVRARIAPILSKNRIGLEIMETLYDMRAVSSADRRLGSCLSSMLIPFRSQYSSSNTI